MLILEIPIQKSSSFSLTNFLCTPDPFVDTRPRKMENRRGLHLTTLRGDTPVLVGPVRGPF